MASAWPVRCSRPSSTPRGRERASVPRPLLTERLRRGPESKLTLISAPAGFGKSTLWRNGWPLARPRVGHRVAVARPGDNQPASFWTNVIAALQAVAPGSARLRCRSSRRPTAHRGRSSPPCSTTSTPLTDEIVLVLDDYHAVDAPEIQAGMTFLLEHLPANVHLVIATRADPALPLARLRARGELVEIRAADLRFTPDEAAAYLNGVMGLGLTARRCRGAGGPDRGLDRRAPAGRRSRCRAGTTSPASSRASPGTTATSSTTSSRRSAASARATSGASCCRPRSSRRLSGPLCDAVTGQDGGKATLEALDRRNLFLIPLDDRRQWYRYHHLFADVLQARLLDEQPELVPELHRRATEWYEQNGEATEAIRHALAGEGLRRGPPTSSSWRSRRRAGHRQEVRLRRWLDALPDELIRVAARAERRVRRVAPGARRGRGRRGAPAGRRAVAGR